jgi:uncharacterized protein YcbK (DUF882 family)
VRSVLLLLALSGAAHDAPSHWLRASGGCSVATAAAEERPRRTARWAEALGPIEIENVVTRARDHLRLYRDDGALDDAAIDAFTRLASNDANSHTLAPRLLQLVVKAAYHFGGARVMIVSGWRSNASRHGTGEALDFKLAGVRASALAAFLRETPRAGVGIYTHPRTQFVHLDVRDVSYHWIDASAPGTHWREGMLRDPSGKRRDASWTPESDLP